MKYISGSGGTYWDIQSKRDQQAKYDRLLEVAEVLSFFQPTPKKKPTVNFDAKNDLATINRGKLMRDIAEAQLKLMKPAWKALKFVTNMRFLEYQGDGKFHLIQADIDWNKDRPPYIAVSYCWRAANTFGWRNDWGSKDRIRVIDKTTQRQTDPSEPREPHADPEVLMRAATFAKQKGIQKIWIDQECIKQSDRTDKEDGIQSMHYVYRGATVTLVLLGQHAWLPWDVDPKVGLARLTEYITQKGGSGDPPKQKEDPNDPVKNLVNNIASDKWFTRSWCTQEYLVSQANSLVFLVGYRSRIGMPEIFGDWELSFDHLRLIAPSLKRSGLLGHPEGRDRWSQIYRLCDPESVSKINTPDPDSKRRRSEQLGQDRGSTPDTNTSRAQHGSFAELNFEMCAPVLSSLGAILNKKNTRHADRLAIVANLCNYQWRLDTNEANTLQMGFSAAVIALALLNGDTSFMFAHPAKQHQRDQWGKVWQRSKNHAIPRWLPSEGSSLYELVQNAIHKQLKPRYGPSCIVMHEHLVTAGFTWKVQAYREFDYPDLVKEFRKLGNQLAVSPEWMVFHSCFVLVVLHLYRIQQFNLISLIIPGVMMINSPMDLIEIVEDLKKLAKQGKKALDDYLLKVQPSQLDHYYPEALYWLYHAIDTQRDLCLGSLEIQGHTVQALFNYADQDHKEIGGKDEDLVFTPINELEYCFGCANVDLDSELEMPASFSWRVVKIEQSAPEGWVTEVCRLLQSGAEQLKQGCESVYRRSISAYANPKSPFVEDTRYQLQSTVECLLPVTLSSSGLAIYNEAEKKWSMVSWEESVAMYFLSPIYTS